jgi:MFS family permease
MMANIYLILYLPGTAFSIFLMKYFDLKRSLEICGTLTMVGAMLRYVAAYNSNAWGIDTTYIVMMFGQSLAAIGQPMFLNSPPAVASIWFPVEEREVATTIGSMFAPIGSAVGQIIPFLLVTQSSRNGTRALHVLCISFVLFVVAKTNGTILCCVRLLNQPTTTIIST